jgi:PAS domain-containing protein
MHRDSTTPPVWDTNRLRIATDAAGVALWSWNVDTDEIALDERAHVMWGVPKDNALVDFETLSARIHPEDLDRVRAAFSATRQVLGGYELDFRILQHGEVRWISARGRGEDQGIVGRIMFGIFLDVSERKLAEEAREMLAGEMSHRVKNLFAIASALTEIAARSTARRRTWRAT